jgi:geranylgeranyl diphosphate synthase type II
MIFSTIFLSESLQNVDIKTLDFIHTHKTGALLETSVIIGGY